MIRGVVALSLILVLGGCVVANAIVEPYTDLHFQAYGNINPDDSGRSSPLVVRVYELNSAAAFRDAGFFELYDNAPDVLGETLLGTTELIVRPGRGRNQMMRLHRNTTHIGVIGAFRDIDNADWKLTLVADPRNYKSPNILIDSLSISWDKG
ncbi:MAG: type VI secretion system lipoprotein TssJ [Alteromonadaceae bacterium]|nr:type VI secretion system lipoprotein TssJ [Alteromonadaceae bacterium]